VAQGLCINTCNCGDDAASVPCSGELKPKARVSEIIFCLLFYLLVLNPLLLLLFLPLCCQSVTSQHFGHCSGAPPSTASFSLYLASAWLVHCKYPEFSGSYSAMYSPLSLCTHFRRDVLARVYYFVVRFSTFCHR
jgi:hypothetical protein